jgi:lysozyme
MNKPNLTLAEAKAIIIKSGFTITESVMVLAIRGYYKDTMGKPGENDRGIYDDAMFLIGPNYFGAFNANTDPSKFKPGIAKLIPGLHFFKKGKHGISHPGGGYPAFRPDTTDESLPVTRDGQTGVSKGIAINLHSGGDVYTNSEGCQTVYKPQWGDFQTKAYQLMSMEGQIRLPYLLIEQ